MDATAADLTQITVRCRRHGPAPLHTADLIMLEITAHSVAQATLGSDFSSAEILPELRIFSEQAAVLVYDDASTVLEFMHAACNRISQVSVSHSRMPADAPAVAAED